MNLCCRKEVSRELTARLNELLYSYICPLPSRVLLCCQPVGEVKVGLKSTPSKPALWTDHLSPTASVLNANLSIELASTLQQFSSDRSYGYNVVCDLFLDIKCLGKHVSDGKMAKVIAHEA